MPTRYRDLIAFEPIETIIQIRDSDEATVRNRVETYVISDRMADQLANVVIPQLQFQTPRDNKGILIVGNYGTGKSHLMSVISAVAEYPDLAAELNHPRVQEAARAIAGKFKVVRTEVGAVTGPLRDNLLRDLEQALARWGISFTFPPADQVTNNKDALIAAVAAFQQHYPDHGILLVVDELLDFLRTREERQLILDLGFLRELGEVAALTTFRFLGGVQETLFDSPRFSFVAEQMRRVRDRFEQVRIAREDIAFVVSHRLLRKTDEQLARITEHLLRFAPLYRRLSERMGEFAQLFPIHPAYIETFERVYVAEKREVLKTLSKAMRELLDREVPTDQPGLISYDHYWGELRDNASMRGLAGVSEVIEKSNVLEGRLQSAYGRQHLLPMASRIVHALSVHRLTTADIYAPLGATAEELRDDLCLNLRMPEPSAQFLLDQVQVALREILRTVSGQYISCNDANGQYYLDVKKDIDFDAKIRERGDFMEEADLNRYFFDALRQAIGLSETTYVTGHRIWPYELPWSERRVARPGYLFFGAPDERSTAQPPRDFYVYVLPPFSRRDWRDDRRSDEVIFQITRIDQVFEDTVRLYAGATALAADSPSHRETYAQKAEESLRRVRRWLQDHFASHLQVTYQGVAQPAAGALAGLRSSASQTLQDLIMIIASGLLAPEFEDRYPEYPAFRRASQPISEAGRGPDAMDAIRSLAGRGRTSLATVVLEGLELLDPQGVVRPHLSRYARRYLELLLSKPEGQVVNRGELIEVVAQSLHPVEKEVGFGLEPEWVAVVLTALAYNGDIVLDLGQREALHASNIERAAMLSIGDLTSFRLYRRPRAVPVSLWVSIFEGLDLNPALVRDESTREDAVRDLHRLLDVELPRVVSLQDRLQRGLQLWNTPLFTDRYTIEVESGVVVGTDLPGITLTAATLLGPLRGYKQFLEDLASFNTPGRLRNLSVTAGRIAEAAEERIATNRAERLVDLVSRLQPLTTYLAEARANLADDHSWSDRADRARKELLDGVRRLAKGEGEGNGLSLAADLEALKRDYIAIYSEQHRRLVLGPQADDRRLRLYRDQRLATLDELASIDLLNASELRAWKEVLQKLPTCREFHEALLGSSPTCPHCHLRPVQRRDRQADQTLDHLDHRLDDLLRGWREALKANLESEVAMASLAAMTPREREPIRAFLAQANNDTTLPQGFVPVAIQALHGLTALPVAATELVDAIKGGGLPCTLEEFRRRIDEFLQRAMRGHDSRNTRITLAE